MAEKPKLIGTERPIPEVRKYSEITNNLVLVIRDDGSYGGWRTELLVEEITGKVEAKFLLCNYCRGMLRDACFYKKDGKQELACSVCVSNDKDKQMADLNRDSVGERQVYCPLKGCNWTNELSELLHHLEECELFPVACPLGCRDEKGEVSRVERRRVETHKTCCFMRSVKCDYCSRKIKYFMMNAHLELCGEFPISCPNECSTETKIKRKDESTHLNQHCLLQEIKCPYSRYGCEVKVQRQQITQHEKEEIHTHLRLTTLVMKGRVEELEKKNEVLQNKNLKLESILLPISSWNVKGEFKWKIGGVKNKLFKKETTFSDPFYVGMYKFGAYIDWSGTEKYIGIFLEIMKGEWDDKLKWPLRYRYSISLINQSDKGNKIKTGKQENYVLNEWITLEDIEKFPDCFCKPVTNENIGFGSGEFVEHSFLYQGNFCRGDSIQLHISVEQMLQEQTDP